MEINLFCKKSQVNYQNKTREVSLNSAQKAVSFHNSNDKVAFRGIFPDKNFENFENMVFSNLDNGNYDVVAKLGINAQKIGLEKHNEKYFFYGLLYEGIALYANDVKDKDDFWKKPLGRKRFEEINKQICIRDGYEGKTNLRGNNLLYSFADKTFESAKIISKDTKSFKNAKTMLKSFMDCLQIKKRIEERSTKCIDDDFLRGNGWDKCKKHKIVENINLFLALNYQDMTQIY